MKAGRAARTYTVDPRDLLRVMREAEARGDDIVAVSLEEATAELKTVPPEWYEVAQSFFG